LIAIDRTDKKTDLVRQTCNTFGADCSVFTFDSTKACSELVPLSKSLLEGPPFHPESFDKVPILFLLLKIYFIFSLQMLLDAPCSALGQRPQLWNQITAKQLKSSSLLQKKLFRSVS
jgi:methyltransferase NSUN6